MNKALDQGAEVPHIAYIGLGSNLGESIELISTALNAIAQWPDVNVVACASFYVTEPIGLTGPDFLNTAAKLEVQCDAFTLMSRLLTLESRMGRSTQDRSGPRLIDLDLLLYDQMVMRSELLILPHPRLHLRAFVLAPLLELGDNIEVPGLGKVSQLIHATANQRIDRLPDIKALSLP